MNPYEKKCTKVIRSVYINRGELYEKFKFKTKPKLVKNAVYYVLRPDKDAIAALFFPNKRIVYLRYDKAIDSQILLNYFSLKENVRV